MKTHDKSLTIADVHRNPSLYPQEYKELQEFGRKFYADFTVYKTYLSESIKPIIQAISTVNEAFKYSPITDFIVFADEKNFSIVIAASDNDKEALEKLNRLWNKLYTSYALMEKQQSIKPTKKRFQEYIHQVCWQAVKDYESTPLSVDFVSKQIQKSAYYALSNIFLTDFKIFKKQYVSDGIIIKNGNQYFLLETLSRECGIPIRTLRRWITVGLLSAEKIQVFSQFRQASIYLYVIPYEIDTLQKIKKTKKQMEHKRSHKKDGFCTSGELATLLKVSRRTIQRYIKSEKIHPRIIQSKIPYFSYEDVKKILTSSMLSTK